MTAMARWNWWKRSGAAVAAALAVAAVVGAGAAPVRAHADTSAAAPGAAATGLLSTDLNADRGIGHAAAAARGVPGDSAVEQVDRAIALFHRRHPGYVAPPTTGGGAPAAAVIAAMDRSRTTGPAVAGIQCGPTWTTIEVGNNRDHFIRPASDLPNTSLYGNGSAAAPWFNWFMLCRDEGWCAGDYGLLANYGGRYVRVNHLTRDVIVADSGITNVVNLLRFGNYDGNFQTMWSPSEGFYIGPGSAGQLSANTRTLTGANLYKVRPLPGSFDTGPVDECG